MTEQPTPQTVAGALRAYIVANLPGVDVYRNNAPADVAAPVAIIMDPVGTAGSDLGDDLLLSELVQVDLYLDKYDASSTPDALHALLHRAPIWVPGSQIHRVQVQDRRVDTNDVDDDGTIRIIYTVQVTRRIVVGDSSTPLPLPVRPDRLEHHEAQTANVHGIANTAELETQTGAQAKADAAENAAIASATEQIASFAEVVGETFVPKGSKNTPGGYAGLDGTGKISQAQIPALPYDAFGAAAAAQAAAIDAANAYTDAQIGDIDFSALETKAGATEKADTAQANAIAYTDEQIGGLFSIFETQDGTTIKVDAALVEAKAYTDSTAIPKTQKAAANGVATLGADGKVPNSQLPPLAISDTYAVASQAAMLALDAQVGDVAVRSDLSKSFILRVSPASVITNWQELLTPPNAVLSVDGRVGAVSLSDLYDASGAASEAQEAAQTASKAYTDTQVASAVSTAASDAAAKANAAQTAAINTSETYTDSQIAAEVARANAAYDAAGAAATVQGHLDTHAADTTDIHGIANTADLETKSGAQTKADAAQTAATAAAATALAGHVSATDPHGDRAAAATALAGHVSATDPHGDRAAAATALAGHVSATDPHGDRAYVDAKVGIANGIAALDSNARFPAGSLQQGTGLAVLGRTANSGGAVQAITAANDGEVLRRTGTTLGFGKIDPTAIAQSTATDNDIIVWNGTAWAVEPMPGDFGYASNVITPAGTGATGASGATTTIFVRAVRGGLINSMGIGIGTGTGSTTVYLAAYSNTGTGRNAKPDARLTQTGAISVSLSTNTQFVEAAVTTPVRIKAGDWLAVSFSTSVNVVGISTISALTAGVHLAQSSAATPPATANPLATPGSVTPVILGIA